MKISIAKPLISALMLAICLVASQGLCASSKMKVKGDVESVTHQVEEAMSQLELKVDHDRSKIEKDWSRAVATSNEGGKVTVNINRAGDGECEVSITGNTLADRNVEEKLLEMMISR
jgi:hypothetical protein